MDNVIRLLHGSGLYNISAGQALMLLVGLLLLYLAIQKKFEPLLLVPIGFGAILSNIPIAGLAESGSSQVLNTAIRYETSIVKDYAKTHQLSIDEEQKLNFSIIPEDMQNSKSNKSAQLVRSIRTLFADDLSVCEHEILCKNIYSQLKNSHSQKAAQQLFELSEIARKNSFSDGILYLFYSVGLLTGVFPLLIFMGVGALTDFGPLLANPKTLLLGAAAQFGIFATLLGALALGFSGSEAAAIAIIGGADGPTAIYVTSKLAPHLLGAIAVAAYSYMALVPMIQPPIMKMLTTQEERRVGYVCRAQ